MELKKCITESLDGSNADIFPFLPYILQDLVEIGADPNIVSKLIREHLKNHNTLKVLDLGCGKGAVSVRIAKEFKCNVLGVDAMPDFVESAKQFAFEMNVHSNCSFELADIRENYKKYMGFDVVILGAIGPVLGNTKETLEKVGYCIKNEGYVIIDDGFVPDNSSFEHDKCTSKSGFFKQVNDAGFEVVAKEIIGKDSMQEQNNTIYNAIKQRTIELIEKHPAKANILNGYLKEQETENDTMENELICGTWLLSLP